MNPESKREKNIKQKRQSRFTPFLLGAMTLILFAGLVVLQMSAWRFIPPDTTSYNLIVFALSSFNFIAFVIFAFMFLRNLVKLRREYKQKEIGSKIRTQFLMAFVLVSFLPICAMAFFSFLFVNRSIDKWFSPLEIIDEARKVQERARREQTENTETTAKALAILLDQKKSDNTDPNQTSDINEELLTRLVKKSGFAFVTISNADGSLISSSEANLAEKDREEIKQAVSVGLKNKSDKTLTDNQEFDLAVVSMSDGKTLVLVPQRRSEENFSEIISNAPSKFDELKQSQKQVRSQGISTLSLLTLLLLFASSWMAIYLARGIATPIKALAEASNEIAKGNLSHRVETIAEDELATLVDSFNQMTAQLEKNRHELNANASELRNKNAELEISRNYIETVLKSLSTGVISLDDKDCVTTINASAALMLQIESSKVEHSPLSSIIVENDLAIIERLVRRARRTGRATEQTELGANGNGSSLPVALTATALQPQEKRTSGVVIVIEDLSEFLMAQRAAAWGEVARRMAHEIKNPLTPIQLSAERIAKNYQRYYAENGNGAEGFERIINECTATIKREVSGLKAMVDEFSDFARLPKAKLEPTDLNKVLTQSIALYEDRLDNVEIDIQLAEELPQAMIDTEQLRRAFVNLIDNALEALEEIKDEKRVIKIKTSYDTSRGLLLAEIKDNGHGIAYQDFPKLFQPYFSTKGRGTGLGLAIVQRIIIEHGGKIRAESNLPKGSKFIVELPVANVL